MKPTLLQSLISFGLAVGMVLPAPIFHARAQNSPPGYLIIAPEDFAVVLGAFVDLKTAQGFETHLALLSETGTTKEEIKTFIKAEAPRPIYVLLAGDTSLIPSWPIRNHLTTAPGPCSGRPCTDLYYTTFDSASDTTPNVILGRLPVRDASQLTSWIDKVIDFDNAPLDAPWRKKISYIANSYETYDTAAEGAHLDAIETWTAPLQFTGTFVGALGAPTAGGDQLFPKTYVAVKSDLMAALNDGRLMAIYFGPGSPTEWRWTSTEPITLSDVAALNGPPLPLVLALAPDTASYSPEVSMANTWILHPTSGALAYIGSSFALNENRDWVLENLFFERLFSSPDAPPAIGGLLNLVLNQFPNYTAAPVAWQYREAYQFFGDPSMTILQPSGGHLESPLDYYTGYAGETIQVPFYLTNTGPFEEDFSLAITTSPYFKAKLITAFVDNLLPNEKVDLVAEFQSIEGTPPGAQQFFDITASLEQIVSTLTISIQLIVYPTFLPLVTSQPQ